jgi:3-dehydroquinate dehydratase/shikimate dehydrogenase
MIPRAERSGANLIEIRLDYMKLDSYNIIDKLEKVVEQTSVPLIATNRQYEQGGERPQGEEQRIKTLIRAAEIGFQYVDIELTTVKLKSTVQKVKSYGAKPIVSFHDFEKTPADSEMGKIVKSQIEAEADICKLVTKAKDVADNIRCLVLAKKMSGITKIVCFAMGNKGVFSRAFSPIFGGYFTYASLESGLETASGQISITELKQLYRELGVDK